MARVGEEEEEVVVFQGPHPRGPVYCAAFEAAGYYVLSGGHDRNVNLFNVRSGGLVSTFAGHSQEVFDLALPDSPDVTTFLSASGDRSVALWDVPSQRVLRRFTGHPRRVTAVQYVGQQGLLSASDRVVRVWDMRGAGRTPVAQLEDAQDGVLGLHQAGHQILTGSIDGYVRCYDLRRGLRIAYDIQSAVNCVRFTRDQQAFLVGSLDSTLRLFDPDSGVLLNAYTGHTNTKYRIQATLFSNDAYLASGSEEGVLYVWDLVAGTVRHSFAGHSKAISCVAAHPKSDTMLLSASLDGTLRLWSISP